LPHIRILEVIPMKKRAYRGISVKCIAVDPVRPGHEGQALTEGVDVGKYQLTAMPRWFDGQFARLWLVDNPAQIRDLIGLLQQLAAHHTVTVALEPSGT
jgi:hypothetical protein